MAKTPHLIQYQGSKRNIAPQILNYFPQNINRLIEPFAGTCAVSILAAHKKKCNSFWVNDINTPLINLMEDCINHPLSLAENYANIWNGQFKEGENNIDYFYKIRDEFNTGKKDSAHMLFLLARVVKGSIRYNTQGNMNQSCDKRRNGTNPKMIASNACGISHLLKNKTTFSSLDYKEVLKMAQPGDLIYMDPPYQGTSNIENSKDSRYIQGVEFNEFVIELEKLNHRGIDYIVSYDGMTGEKKIGKDLPSSLNLTHLYINAGMSSQATLNGKNEITYESLYLSPRINIKPLEYEQLEMVFE